MHLTKKGEYALRTLIRLGLAERLGRDVVSVSELAEGENLPFKFIERGKEGGCRLAKPMKEVTIGELVRLIDGRLAPIGCASETDYEKCTCPDEQHCGLRMLMIDVRNAIARILDRYTLDDVVSVALRKMERDGISPPFEELARPTPAARKRIIKPRRVQHADPLDGFFAILDKARVISTRRS
jgi:Rrf2 family protein